MEDDKMTEQAQTQKPVKPRKAKPLQRATVSITTIDGHKITKISRPGNGRAKVQLDRHGMTEKQAMFTKLVANGSSLKDAYIAAYDTENMHIDTIYTNASVLAADNRISTRIQQLRDIKEASASHSPEHIRDIVLKYLVETVSDKSLKPQDRSKAAELLGKVTAVSLFSENTVTTTVTDSRSAQDRLADAMAKLQPIDPTDVQGSGTEPTEQDSEPNSKDT